MKYLDALIAREDARRRLTELTEDPTDEAIRRMEGTDKSDRSPPGERASPSVSFVGTLPGASIRNDTAPSVGGENGCHPPCDPPYPWRAGLLEWPIPWREAWGRRSNELELEAGLCWWEAEQRAIAEVSHLKERGLGATDHAPGIIFD